MDNVFPAQTDSFLKYYSGQLRNQERFDSWFKRTAVHKSYFTDAIAERELTETNHELVFAILDQIPNLLESESDEDVDEVGGAYEQAPGRLWEHWQQDIGLESLVGDDMRDEQALAMLVVLLGSGGLGLYYVLK